ncbi:hypothetical protein JHK86_003590 [Glycine max]|nr:hypothetical protein JHK86_003590 [Glycine max]
MRKYFTWLVDETANKQDFLRGFHCVPCEKGEVGFKAEKVVSDAREPGQDMDKEVNALEKTEGDIGIGPDVAVGLSSFMEETCTQDPTLLNDEEKEKIIQELICCLPSCISGSNVVEAVSNFYKRETEFHEQVISCQNPVSTPKGCSLNTDSLAKPCLNTNNTGKNIDIFSSQDSKLNNLRHTVPSPISPAKRKRSSDSKQKKKKKPKVKARSEPSGSKQATITRFFSKLIPEMPGGAHSYNSEPKLDQSSKVEDLLPTDDRQLYKDEIDQFMQIINGNESLKKYAITIIEKTKGDINKALDIYYGNSEYLGENKISVESKIDRPEQYLHAMFLSHSLSALSLADVLPAVYLCNTKIGADHENKGDVAQECRQTHKSVVKHRLLATPTPLLIKDVFSALQKISVGSGSTSRKKGIIVHLMHSYCEKEMKFLVRTLIGNCHSLCLSLFSVWNLRIGAMLRTIFPALAHAIDMNSCPTLHQEGTAKNIKDKLHGESTSRFPDLIDIFKGSSKLVASTFIMDAEIVDIDRKNGYRIMSFQVLSSRRRGGKDTLVTAESIKIEVDDACLTYEATLTKINAFLEDALCSSCEGILVKTLDVDAGYSPSKHSDKWLKVSNYATGLWSLCLRLKNQNFFNIPQMEKEIEIDIVVQMKELFSRDKVLSKKPPYYQTGVASDMWFCPQVVWEIRGAYFTPYNESRPSLTSLLSVQLVYMEKHRERD